MTTSDERAAVASVVIPAHNEAAVIGALIDELFDDQSIGLEVVVVCNGCTDNTAAVVRQHAPAVVVIEIDEASKSLALRAGNDAATRFPRLYVDADVVLSATAAHRLVQVLDGGSLLAAGPQRRLDLSDSSVAVRWYYDVWERLPQVQSGLFGRGVIAVSEAGYARLRELPPMMGDDLVAAEAFPPSERTIVADAEVTIWPPRSMTDLIQRRIRAATGNAEADRAGLRSTAAKTSWTAVAAMVRREPRLFPKVLLFVGVAGWSRLRARRAIRTRDQTWRRDDSSRVRSSL
ncbi:MAG: glycosyltransferase [Actinomycetota bacterium]